MFRAVSQNAFEQARDMRQGLRFRGTHTNSQAVNIGGYNDAPISRQAERP